MFKRFVCIILSTVMLLLISSPVFAVPVETTALPAAAEPVTMESILSDFHAQTLSADGQDSAMIKQNTINQLTEAGYSAYDLNPATLSSLENALNTDFSAMGLDPEGSYLIIVSGEDQPSAEISPITPPGGTDICGVGDGVLLPPIHQYDPDYPVGGDSFYYSYGGKTYLMRYVTVTATEDPNYGQSSYLDLIEVYPEDIMNNLLDTLFIAFIDKLNEHIPFGTIGSIFGLSFPDINFPNTETLLCIYSTNWTRVFTQVYDPTYDAWSFCSCVEYARLRSRLTGDYYSSAANEYVSVPEGELIEYCYSENYDNYTWRKTNAVQGFEQRMTFFDVTGKVDYYWGTRHIGTHWENF